MANAENMNVNFIVPTFEDFTQALIAGIYFFFLGVGFLILKGLKKLSPLVWKKILEALKEVIIQWLIQALKEQTEPTLDHIRSSVHDIKNKEVNESSLADLSFDFFKNLFHSKGFENEYEKIIKMDKNKQAKLLLLIEKANELFGYDKENENRDGS